MQYLSHKQYKDVYDYYEKTEHLPNIKYIETMVTHGCTLACDGCNNYSDYGMSGGNVNWDTHFQDLCVLFSRIRVDCYGFIGGEPFMHNKFKDWVINFKEEFPYTTLMVVTNAQLFPRNADWFLDAMEKYGMIYLKFTNHIPDADYIEQSKRLVLERFNWAQEREDYWFCQDNILDFTIAEIPTFMRVLKGTYGNMKPWDNDPEQAFEICSQQICPLFYEGKIHKCSTVGMLDRMLLDNGQLDDPDWATYINQGIDIRTATDELLSTWAENFGKPHTKLCRMCPTASDNIFFDHYPKIVNKIGIT